MIIKLNFNVLSGMRQYPLHSGVSKGYNITLGGLNFILVIYYYVHRSSIVTTVFSLGYQYCDQLLTLENCVKDNSVQLPDCMCRIVTPMKITEWSSMLATYPDKRFVNFLLRGIEKGFRIGFTYTSIQLKSHYQNLLSAMDHPQVVQDYLERELEAEQVIKVGGLEKAWQQGIHCSPFGVIPKKHKPDA